MIRLENVLKRSLQDVLKTSWRCLEDVFARRLEDVLKTYDQDDYIGLDQDVLKTSSEDVWVRRISLSWSRCFEDVFWRWRRKTCSRRLHHDECLLGHILTKPNFIKNHIKCESLSKTAANLTKQIENKKNKNVDQLQLKPLTNPVNIETNGTCNVFV